MPTFKVNSWKSERLIRVKTNRCTCFYRLKRWCWWTTYILYRVLIQFNALHTFDQKCNTICKGQTSCNSSNTPNNKKKLSILGDLVEEEMQPLAALKTVKPLPIYFREHKISEYNRLGSWHYRRSEGKGIRCQMFLLYRRITVEEPQNLIFEIHKKKLHLLRNQPPVPQSARRNRYSNKAENQPYFSRNNESSFAPLSFIVVFLKY